MQLRIAFAFFVRAHCWLSVHQESQVLFCKAAFLLGGPPACPGAWACSSPGAGLCIFLWWTPWGCCQHISPSCQSPCAQPSGLSTSPPSYASSANLLRVHSASSSRPLMKMSNKVSSSTDPCGTLLTTGLQLDFMLLVAIFWAWLFS